MSDPLRDAAPAEIRLLRPPLHRVLVAVNFPAILKISEISGITGFQERIRKLYPNLQREQQMAFDVQFGPSGEMLPPQNVVNTVWRFLSSREDWRVSLSTDMIALEADEHYKSRDDLIERLTFILRVFNEEFEPSDPVRIGVRYLNVIEAVEIDAIKGVVRQGLRSLSDTEIAEHISNSNHSVTFDVPEGQLLARWGLVPANMTHDPNFLAPSEAGRRWFLDLDCYSSDVVGFGEDHMANQARTMAERIYSFFRWAMEPSYIESCNDA